MYHLIYIIRRDTGLDLSGRYIKHLPRQPAHLPHPTLRLLVQDLYRVPSHKLVIRIAIFGVVGMWYRIRHWAFGRQGVGRP